MKAIIYTTYGPPDVLQLKEIESPTPADDEVLVRVHAASANAGDWHLLRGKPFMIRLTAGLLKPKNTILGADVAGRVEAVGRNVTQFQPGDAVFGDVSDCGYGGFAEYVCVPEHALARKPASISFEEAAAVPSAAITALQGLRNEGHIQPGQKVLINGASGGVGMFAVQIAKSFGAEVTGVCSTRSVDMVRSIGADHVIDYKHEDFTKNGHRYDVILDAAAYRSLSDHQRALGPKGIYVLVGGSGGRYVQVMVVGPRFSKNGGQRFGTFVKKPTHKDLEVVKDLLEAGKIVPVIDRRYPLPGVPAALRYLEEGHTQGKVVIDLENKQNI